MKSDSSRNDDGQNIAQLTAATTPRSQLLSRIHKTKGARFAAYDRLTKKHNANGYTVAILSFYVICISIVSLIYSDIIDRNLANFLTFVSVALSILIIILSLLVASQRYDVRANLMHFCGRELLDLYTELKFVEEDLDFSLETFRKRYQNIINKYPDNHDNIDRMIYEVDEGKSQSHIYYRLRSFISIYGASFLYLFGPLLALFVFFRWHCACGG